MNIKMCQNFKFLIYFLAEIPRNRRYFAPETPEPCLLPKRVPKSQPSTLGGATLELPGHGGVVFVAESGARRVCPAGSVPSPTRRVCPAGSVTSPTRAPDTTANQNSIWRPKQNINRAELGKVNFVRVKALER